MHCASLALLLVALCALPSHGYNPDQYLTTPEIIRRHGYASESHVVATEDGYLLTLHRIPSGKNQFSTIKKVVFLQHGLLSSSTDWVLNGPNKSLAYILADNNYDVWMGNARGNTYSKAHVNLSSDDPEFWNFTWHEMAVFDLPAEIDYILAKVDQRVLFYIGHSMGTTMFFALSSTRAEYGSKVKGMFALAPVAFVAHIKSPVRLLAPWADDLQFLATYLGHGAFLPNNKMVKLMSKYGCELVTWEKDVCSNVIFVICGFDHDQFNMTLLPLILAHSPAGTSTKTVIHYAQEIKSGNFQQFDYGRSGNLEKYGTPEPPKYNLALINTPVSLHYADNDWLSSQIDVEHLYDGLPKRLGKFLIKYKGFNHIDFLWGKDAKTLVYNDILRILRTL